jgi:hypothetical protein
VKACDQLAEDSTRKTPLNLAVPLALSLRLDSVSRRNAGREMLRGLPVFLLNRPDTVARPDLTAAPNRRQTCVPRENVSAHG